eukprot:Blabericola_migrator_1__871@NODE_1213_length_5100_cov_46_971985_g823_i0_p6_GENE_NODE_1213_length_5100_cov_46_971985_g823_i0NODE_1213_length_5100_cov_46_971985_g823_i0_p6_ORF_typecomplete_len111_score1_94COE1_DBD/PF16422_5/0_027_NODE_1213_length_5100_cov_46_971985_g823_i029823314
MSQIFSTHALEDILINTQKFADSARRILSTFHGVMCSSLDCCFRVSCSNRCSSVSSLLLDTLDVVCSCDGTQLEWLSHRFSITLLHSMIGTHKTLETHLVFHMRCLQIKN